MAKLKNDCQALHDILNMFGLTPEPKIRKEEKMILEYLKEAECGDYLTICNDFDFRPSELEYHVNNLLDNKLVYENEEETAIMLTDLGHKLVNRTKKQAKMEKKFMTFLDCLTPSELNEFYLLCQSFSFQKPEVPEMIEEVVEGTEEVTPETEN